MNKTVYSNLEDCVNQNCKSHDTVLTYNMVQQKYKIRVDNKFIQPIFVFSFLSLSISYIIIFLWKLFKILYSLFFLSFIELPDILWILIGSLYSVAIIYSIHKYYTTSLLPFE